MLESLLLALALAAAALVALYGAGRWVARMEERATERRLLERVYYSRRGRKAQQGALARRQQQPRGNDGAPPDE